MKSKQRLSSLLLCSALLVTFAKSGQALTLRWDSNTESDLAGYRIFRATFSLLNRTTDQAMTNSNVVKTQSPGKGTSSPISGLAVGTTYYFRLTAYNASGEQSRFNLSPSGTAVEVSTCLRAPAAAAPVARNAFLQLTQSAPAQVPNLVKNLVLVRGRFANVDTGQPLTLSPSATAPSLRVRDNLGTQRSIPMSRLANGEFVGTIDTALLDPAATSVTYVCEGPHPDLPSTLLKSSQGSISLTGTATLTPSSAQPGLFTVPDGNPVDGDFAVRFDRGDTASQINIATVANAPVPPNTTMVAAYDLSIPGREHAQFNRAAGVTFVYRDADGVDKNGDGLPDGDGKEDLTGLREEDLRVYWLDKRTNTWQLVGGVVDRVKNTVTARTTHFSVFAIMFSRAVGAPRAAQASEKFLTPALQDGYNDYATFGLDVKDVSIFDVNGRLVFRETSDDMNDSAITWTARDDRGEVVPSGVYIAKIVKKDGGTVYQSLAVAK